MDCSSGRFEKVISRDFQDNLRAGPFDHDGPTERKNVTLAICPVFVSPRFAVVRRAILQPANLRWVASRDWDQGHGISDGHAAKFASTVFRGQTTASRLLFWRTVLRNSRM